LGGEGRGGSNPQTTQKSLVKKSLVENKSPFRTHKGLKCNAGVHQGPVIGKGENINLREKTKAAKNKNNLWMLDSRGLEMGRGGPNVKLWG